MDRYKAYLLPGVAALLLLAYYVWRWTSSESAPEPETPAKAASEPKAEPDEAGRRPAQPSQPAQ